MIAGDVPLVVRRGNRAIRIANMDVAADGVFVPGNGDVKACIECSAVISGIIAVLACFALTIVLVNYNDWWTETQCDYSNCTVSTNNIADSYVTIEIMLTRGETRMVSKIRTLAVKAPYICQITTGACYATCKSENRIYANPKLSLEKIHAISGWALFGIALSSLPLLFAIIFLCSVGSCYGYAMADAIHFNPNNSSQVPKTNPAPLLAAATQAAANQTAK